MNTSKRVSERELTYSELFIFFIFLSPLFACVRLNSSLNFSKTPTEWATLLLFSLFLYTTTWKKLTGESIKVEHALYKSKKVNELRKRERERRKNCNQRKLECSLPLDTTTTTTTRTPTATPMQRWPLVALASFLHFCAFLLETMATGATNELTKLTHKHAH